MSLLRWLVGIMMCIGVLTGINAQSLDSCNYSIQGAVFDQESKDPLAFASVQISLDGKTIGAYTDEKGLFEINGLCKKEYDLQFSFIGYKKVIHHHDFYHPFVEIYLAPKATQLESVVLEGKRTQSDLETITSTTISGRELEALKSENFGELVSQITGVNTINTGQNVSNPVIHGLHSNRILVINNGLRHAFQNWSIDHAPEIDPSAINNLEVVKGAATVRFGPDALGGVILTNPSPMELSSPFKGHLQLTGKSNGRSLEGNTEIRKGYKWLSVLAGGSYLKQGDLQAPNYNLTNTGKEEYSYYGGFRLHPLPELDIEGFYSKFDQNLGILSGSTFGNLEDIERAIDADIPNPTFDFTYDIGQPRQKIVHDLYKAVARYTGEQQSIEVQYGYQMNRRKEFGVRRGNAPNINLELATHSIDANWLHPAIGPLSGRLGFQWQDQANDNLPGTNTVPFIPNFDSKRYGFYLIENLKLGRNTFELGLRYDDMEADITGREPNNTIYRNQIQYENVTATLGYRRKIGENASFQTNLGSAWRPPNVAELYRFGQHAFFLEYGLWRYTIDERFDFVSTSQGILTEEDRAVPSEVGYKWINTFGLTQDDFQMEATAYVNLIENYIYAKPGGVTRTTRGYFVYYIYDQTDALIWGIDLHTSWDHHEQWSSVLKGSYLWAKQIDENDFFAEQPPARLDYSLAYSPSSRGLKDQLFSLGLNYTFEQFQHPRILSVSEFLNANQSDTNRFADDASDFDILAPPPGFLLTNLGWEASWKELEWRVQVKNLFDVSYRNYTDRLRYFADNIGRNVSVSLTYRW